MGDRKPQRDAQRTRAAILDAARDAFSSRGYAAAGLREITAAAGVNPALVSRYFGSKEKLFEAALAELLDGAVLTRGPRETFGEAVVALLTDHTAARRNPLPMMLFAGADPGARAIVQRLLEELTLAPLADWLGPVEGRSRAARFAALASGLTVYRAIYPLTELASPLDPAARAWFAATFQSLVD
ncbi:MAG: TetR family transcriptional regulator [Novosphingobium sp.]|nr:TetR family transcriptional regulator [Novosphingobium sp.]